MSDILSANDLKVLGLVLAQVHLSRLKQLGLDIEDTHSGRITKEKVADALKQIGQDQLALVLRDKRGKKLFHYTRKKFKVGCGTRYNCACNARKTF